MGKDVMMSGKEAQRFALIQQVLCKSMTPRAAASALGLSERQIKRLSDFATACIYKVPRVFVTFFYGDGKAVLAETHPMTMLHKPLGLRLASGIVCPTNTFSVSNVVIKGDDAPIRIVMVAQNPV